MQAPTAKTQTDRVLAELSHLLWRQRSLLGRLQYRLEVQQLILASGRHRWVGQAADDVESVLDEIRVAEEERARLLAVIAPFVGGAHSLGRLAQLVPAPWDEILTEHHQAFLALVAEAEQAAHGNRELLHRGLTDTRLLIDTLTGAEQVGYARSGHVAAGPSAATLIDRDA